MHSSRESMWKAPKGDFFFLHRAAWCHRTTSPHGQGRLVYFAGCRKRATVIRIIFCQTALNAPQTDIHQLPSHQVPDGPSAEQASSLPVFSVASPLTTHPFSRHNKRGPDPGNTGQRAQIGFQLLCLRETSKHYTKGRRRWHRELTSWRGET